MNTNETRKEFTDNELIAEFMGLRKMPEERFEHLPIEIAKHIDGTAREVMFYKPEQMEYSTSWDWLMPVVEKMQEPELNKSGTKVVRTGAEVTIFYKACHIEYEPDEESGDKNEEWDFQTGGKTKIEATYKAVVEFIKWHNQQPK